jgi:hypothetical protein
MSCATIFTRINELEYLNAQDRLPPSAQGDTAKAVTSGQWRVTRKRQSPMAERQAKVTAKPRVTHYPSSVIGRFR